MKRSFGQAFTNCLWTLVRVYAWFRGVKIVRAKRKKHLLDALDLYNEVYSKSNIIKQKVPESDWVYGPEDICIVIYKKGVPIATATMFDLAHKKPYCYYYYQFTMPAAYQDKKMMEVTRVIIQEEHRSGDFWIFFLLHFKLYQLSIPRRLDFWLTSTSKQLLRTIKRFNKEAIEIARGTNLLVSDDIQSRFNCNLKTEYFDTPICFLLSLEGFDFRKILRQYFKLKRKSR